MFIFNSFLTNETTQSYSAEAVVLVLNLPFEL